MKTINYNDAKKFVYDEGYESVLLFLKNDKVTLCISSQIGCKFNCSFCKTGSLGFTRNLTKNEIVEQYLDAKEIAKVTSIVFMGMGEPLDNYKNVTDAIFILNEIYNFPLKRITVSTVGLTENLIKLNQEFSVKLALSLNATNDELRLKLMPSHQSIQELVDASKKLHLPKNKPLMISYILLKGVNDKFEDVIKIKDLFNGVNIIVNLIPYNNYEGTNYDSSDNDHIEMIKAYFIEQGIKAFIRKNVGTKINAACGTLG